MLVYSVSTHSITGTLMLLTDTSDNVAARAVGGILGILGIVILVVLLITVGVVVYLRQFK